MAPASHSGILCMLWNLRGSPLATVITAEIDPLHSEGITLADKLKAAGVDVNYKNIEGVTHEFFGMTGVLDESKAAAKLAAKNLMRAFKGAASQRQQVRTKEPSPDDQ